jgi:hypothetical protein
VAESCADYFKKNLGEALGLAKQGVSDAHYRVKYAGLGAMAMIYRECAPNAQQKTQHEVLPVLVKLMLEEPLIKMQTQATSVVLSFVNGLQNEDDEEEEAPVDAKENLAPYCKQLLQALVVLL